MKQQQAYVKICNIGNAIEILVLALTFQAGTP